MIVYKIYYYKSSICLNFVYFNTLGDEIKKIIDQSIKDDSFVYTFVVFLFFFIAIIANSRFF